MSAQTHCIPSGSLGTGELYPPNITSASVTSIHVPSGLKRGVVVFLHGLSAFPTQAPPGLSDSVSAALPALNAYAGTLATILAADGWEVFEPLQLQDIAYNPTAGVLKDFSNDAGLGSRFLTNTQHWWDHVVEYKNATYGPTWPIVLVGFSGGGWLTLQLAALETASITAFVAGHPATLFSNISQVFAAGYGAFQTNGMDLSGTALNAVTIPGFVSYGTSDSAVAYGGVSTVASGSNGVAASSVTTLSVASNTDFISNSQLVKVTGLTGGVGWATFSFTGTGTNTLTGCALVGGSGTLATGNPVVQSTTKALIAAQQAAQPSHQIVANITTNNHGLLPSDAGQQLASTPSATALSSMGTLTVASTQGMTGATGQMSIFASDGLWHVVSFTGSSSTTFTGCTYSGTTSATVVNGSPICLSGNGSTHPMSYPYFVSTVVDPLCPKQF